tara:strand:+ start:5179 stop:6342 length:1164 start_codon:yes stop_codon:yes gene_type:complete
LKYLKLNGKVSNISFSKNSTDGGISNSVKIIDNYLKKEDINSQWVTYENISNLKKSNFLKNYLISLNNVKDIVHFHGLWRAHSRLTNLNEIKYVISPHGMLMPNCLKRSKLKKSISSIIWEDSFIKKATYLFTLSIQEASTIPKKYINKKIILFPNSVHIPSNKQFNHSLSPPWAKDIKDSKKVLLFLSRFDSLKGIYLLIDAWKNLTNLQKINNWGLAIVGYGDNGKLKKYIEVLKNENQLKDVFVYPPAFGEIKDICFRKADAFILPSLSEASPMAALEALSYGKPSIISKACGIYETAIHINKRYQKSYQMPYIECLPQILSIQDSLDKLFNMNQKLLRDLSYKSIEFINKNHNLEDNFWELLNIYKCILENKKIPSKYLYDQN